LFTYVIEDDEESAPAILSAASTAYLKSPEEEICSKCEGCESLDNEANVEPEEILAKE
jgi:hypothetical protein